MSTVTRTLVGLVFTLYATVAAGQAATNQAGSHSAVEPPAPAEVQAAPAARPVLYVIGLSSSSGNCDTNPFFADSVLRTMALDLAVRWNAEIQFCDAAFEGDLPAAAFPRLKAQRLEAGTAPAIAKGDYSWKVVLEVAPGKPETLFELPAADASFAAVEKALQEITARRSAGLASTLGIQSGFRTADTADVGAVPGDALLEKADFLAATLAAAEISRLLRARPCSPALRQAGLWANVTLAALYPHPYLHDRSRWAARLMAEHAVLSALNVGGYPEPRLRAWLAWASGYPAEALQQLEAAAPADSKDQDGRILAKKLSPVWKALWVFAKHDWRQVDAAGEATSIEQLARIDAMVVTALPVRMWAAAFTDFCRERSLPMPLPFYVKEDVELGHDTTSSALTIAETNLLKWVGSSRQLTDQDRAALLRSACGLADVPPAGGAQSVSKLLSWWQENDPDTAAALAARAVVIRDLLESLRKSRTWPGPGGSCVLPQEELADYHPGLTWEAMERRVTFVANMWSVPEQAEELSQAWGGAWAGRPIEKGLLLPALRKKATAPQTAYIPAMRAYTQAVAGARTLAMARLGSIVAGTENRDVIKIITDAARRCDPRSADELDARAWLDRVRGDNPYRRQLVECLDQRYPWSREGPILAALRANGLKPLRASIEQMPYSYHRLHYLIWTGTGQGWFDSQPELIRTYADQMLAMAPQADDVWAALSDCYAGLGLYDDQIRMLRKYCDLPPMTVKRSNITARLSHLLLAKGETAEAQAWAEKAATTGAYWPGVAMANCYWAKGDPQAAADLLREITGRYDEGFPEFVRMRLYRGDQISQVVAAAEKLAAEAEGAKVYQLDVSYVLAEFGFAEESRQYQAKHADPAADTTALEISRQLYMGNWSKALEVYKSPAGAELGKKMTADLILAYMAALAAGDEQAVSQIRDRMRLLTRSVLPCCAEDLVMDPSQEERSLRRAIRNPRNVAAMCLAGWQEEFLFKDIEKARKHYWLANKALWDDSIFRFLARSRLLALGETKWPLMPQAYNQDVLKTLKAQAANRR